MLLDWNSFLTHYQALNGNSVIFSILKQAKLVENDGSRYVFQCGNLGMKQYLDGKRPEIEESLYQFTKKRLTLVFEVKEKKQKNKIADNHLPILEFQTDREALTKKAGLQTRFTFDNFAVSPSNHIAHAAAQAVAKSPGHTYNPLFIYGDVGVGKTHLSQAIANRIFEGNMNKKILYCSSEQFTNDLVECIREKNTQRLRKKYRSLDILLIDDVQFIAGKNYVQEEFYHTFNTIVQNGGQVILTSDRPPKEIKELESRLSSRFSGGLIIDMQKPDYELRTAILLIKARERNIDIDTAAAGKIAEKVKDSRELEGALLKLLTLSLSSGAQSNHISMESTVDELKRRDDRIRKKISPVDVIKTVSAYYGLKPSQIKGDSRKSDFVRGRQVVMYLLREVMRLKLDEVAFILNRRDHTTVIHGSGKINSLRLRDPLFRDEINNITESLGLST